MDTGTSGEQLDFVLLDEAAPNMRVVKANALIEAHYELTVKEHKMLALAIARISKNQTQFREQVFSVVEIADLLGVTKRSIYGELDRISSGLMKKQVEIRHEESGSFVKYQLVTKSWCYNGNFGIRISDELAPYLLGLVGEYTRYDLARILPMDSHYAVRLFELLRQYGSFGTRTFTLDPDATKDHKWKDFSKVMGYDPASYVRFSNLNQRILKPAIDQVRRFGEFKTLSVEKIRFGRRTIALKFTWVREDGFEHLADSPLYKNMLAIGVKASVARDVFNRHGQDRIERNMLLTHDLHAKGEIANPAGYFIKGVDEDYAKSAGMFAVDEEGDKASVGAVSSQPGGARSADPKDVDARGGEVINWQEHPIYSHCATKVEYEQMRALERKRGECFASYNEFHQHLLQSKYGKA